MTKGFLLDEGDWDIKPKPQKQAHVPHKTGCGACGLHRRAISPKTPAQGDGRMRIMIVGDAPGTIEDGGLLRKSLSKQGISLDKDCIVTSVVHCQPTVDGRKREPTPSEIMSCRPRLEKHIRDAKPEMIFAFGSPAIQAVLSDNPGLGVSATNMQGRLVPSRLWNCWVACCFHPSWFAKEEGKFSARMDGLIQKALLRLCYHPELPPLLDPDAFTMLEDLKQAEDTLEKLGSGTDEIALDYEATGLSPWRDSYKLLSIAVTDSPDHAWFIPLDHPHAMWGEDRDKVFDLVKKFLLSPCPKVIQNWQYEELASKVVFGVGVNNVVCDTMVREHVLDNRRGVCGQKFQEYVRYGTANHKDSVDQSNLRHEWMDDLARYNCLDVRYGMQWKLDQDIEMDADLTRAYNLFHEAVPVLASCTLRGIKIDRAQLDALDVEVAADIDKLEDVKRNAKCVKQFKVEVGDSFDIGSHSHKKRMFFGILGLKPLAPTDTGSKDKNWRDKPEMCQSDQAALENCLEQVDKGSEEWLLLRACLDESKLSKLHGTYIKGLAKLIYPDGKLHPLFHLHLVDSYRSSSSKPNFQNFPKHDKDMARVRRVMVPQNDGFLEADYNGLEVGGYGCITKDERLIECLTSTNPKLKDFHRRYAARLFDIPFEDVTSDERFHGKSGFVFPKFYGSSDHGIATSNAGRWPRNRVLEVYAEFDKEFAGVLEWQKENWRHYLEYGYIQYLTGFRCRFGKHGMLIPTQASNVPCQGAGFHRLLRALIDSEAEMRRREMKSFIMGQIHDSIVTDFADDEKEEVIDLQGRIMSSNPPGWEWTKTVPWKAEFSVGKNLIDLEEI